MFPSTHVGPRGRTPEKAAQPQGLAFDLLEQDGEDVARLPQIKRKERLEALLANVPAEDPIAYSEHIVGQGAEVFKAMCDGVFEGVIAKSPTARY